MLEASVIAAQLRDVRISEGDQFLLYMRNLPGKVQKFVQLHQNATTVQQVFLGVQDYYISTRVQGDMGSIHVTQPVGKPQDMLQLRKEGPFGRELSGTQEVQSLWQESLLEVAKVGEKVEGRRKEEERETSFEELMGKKNKMTKNMTKNMKRKTRVRITQSQKLIQVLEDL